jgi:hypothetical protein
MPQVETVLSIELRLAEVLAREARAEGIERDARDWSQVLPLNILP